MNLSFTLEDADGPDIEVRSVRHGLEVHVGLVVTRVDSQEGITALRQELINQGCTHNQIVTLVSMLDSFVRMLLSVIRK